MTTTIAPNQTLYVSGINEKVPKKTLRESLYYLFAQHGKVIDVVALKTLPARGQAFVVFSDIQEATAAMRLLQGFPLFTKNIKIAYAKSKSNAVKIRDGTMFQRTDEAEVAKKRARDVEDDVANKRVKDSEDVEDESNEILFLSNLPPNVTEDALATLFHQYPGFKEVRIVPGKNDIAFAEYATSSQAAAAKNVLDGFQISATHSMAVGFANR